MFDTIKTYLSKDQIGVNKLFDYCEPFISDVTIINSNYYQCMTGLLTSGQKVSITHNGISFQGSMAKYYNDTNLIDLNPIEIGYAIEKLSDEMHLPMEKSKVTQLHIGLNLETNYSADVYFPAYGNKNGFERHKQNNGIYFSNTSGTIVLNMYDKIRECKSHKTKIPPELKGKNITRPELRLKAISKYFNLNGIFLTDLQNKDFQIESINALINEFESINILNLDEMNTEEIKTPNDYILYCAGQYLINQGPESTKAHLKQLKQGNAFRNSESYSRLNKSINKITSNKSKGDNRNMIDEISTKLKEKASMYR